MKDIVEKVPEQRVKILNDLTVKNKRYVLYWMQSSHRADYNFALSYAILKANKLDVPLIAFFGLTPEFPEANLRHYHFMLEGLKKTSEALQEMGIKMVVLTKSPNIGVVELADQASLVVVDRGYLKTLKGWYEFASKSLKCPLVQVEDNVIVPVEVASEKEEYSAATLRPKIIAKQNQFIVKMDKIKPHRSSTYMKLDSVNLDDIDKLTSSLGIDKSVKKSRYFKGGSDEATKRLENFIEQKLSKYLELRNDPAVDYQSNLSPYLHFGQISPLYVALQISESKTSAEAKKAYLEELIVRRELAVNYVNYQPNYDALAALPEWAKRTLIAHKNDDRNYLYEVEELENAKTHDPYWNAAQNEMRTTGKMHGYMRMYWGKKLIEWSKTPEAAFKTAIYLNNKYELDGRDPNSYAGIAWCFGKHDRPWKERPIFGKVRYMNQNGLRRKFDVEKYVERVKHL
ncbi:MAG: deoxyribodipyrimidine photo-lyase [Candidatus Bathyarchaeota archaeon]|nr:deoxyribodipyrimidine photo-lyase [Candidatus Bathyarchaeota archaeon]